MKSFILLLGFLLAFNGTSTAQKSNSKHSDGYALCKMIIKNAMHKRMAKRDRLRYCNARFYRKRVRFSGKLILKGKKGYVERWVTVNGKRYRVRCYSSCDHDWNNNNNNCNGYYQFQCTGTPDVVTYTDCSYTPTGNCGATEEISYCCNRIEITGYTKDDKVETTLTWDGKSCDVK